MIASLIGLLLFVLRILSWALLLYCVMSFVMPQNDLYRKLARYVEPLLDPIRRWLFRLFPALGRMAVDVSPLGLWLVIEVATSVLTALRNLLR